MDYNFFNIYKNSPFGDKYRSLNNLNPLIDSSIAQYRANAEYDILAADNPNSLTLPTQIGDTISIGNPSDNNYGITLYVCGLNEISNVTKLSFDIKISNYVYNKCLFYYELCLADSNGNVDQSLMGAGFTIAVRNTQYSGSATRNIDGDTWEHVDVTFNNPSNVNYFLIGGWWGTYEIKNITITGDGTYNWQSVPSISGKNGILSLVTLDSESVNDGEPVSGAAVSVFDQNPVSGNNVKDIVDGNTPLIPSAVDVTAAFIISNPPVGELASRILAAKKDSIPESIEDADKTVSIPANASNVTMPGLDENSKYYFAIFISDASGNTAVSDPKNIYTSADEGWLFDYTGQIQIFVAPKTGIYRLETWGAQGGDATDGTNSARGGYGAYAYGEALLNQGDTLYINVGGQNGYGGGGNPVTNIMNIIKNNTYNPDATPQGIDITNNVATYAISSGSGSWTLVNSQLSEYLLTNKTLICYMSGNIRYALTSDGIFRRSSNRPSMATHTFIPVNRRINLQKLHFKHKDYSRYGDYFQGTVGVGYVENGEFKMGATMDLDLRSTAVSDWTSKEIDLSSVPYIDYIYIVWYDGCEDFKDFEIEYI